ncbi:MAG: hypothetical protein HY879_21145 [Deltaproteobacteria bacterium]|nr:hypothetical protein [Deltaproteobacteria bacterium]
MKFSENPFRQRALLFTGLLFIFGLSAIFAYSNILNAFFLADDFELILGAKKFGPFAPWTPGAAQGFFRPLITLSFFIDYRLWALNPTGYHATNLICHAFNSLLIFLIGFTLLSRQKPSPVDPRLLAFLSGFFFLILPCHTESVTWISGRTDLVATFFCLASFRAYLSFQEKRKIVTLSLSMLFFLLALLSKESILLYPLLILGYEGYEVYAFRFKKENWMWCLWVAILFGVVFCLYIIIKYAASGSVTLGYGLGAHFGLRPLKVFKDVLLFLTRPFIPPISVDFQTFLHFKALIAEQIPFWVRMITAILLAGFLLFILPKLYQKIIKNHFQKEMLGLLLFLFFGAVLFFIPALSSGISLRDTNNERFIYLPSAFYSIFLTLIFLLLFKKKIFCVGVFIGLFMIFTISLHRLNENWRIAGELSRNAVQDLLKVEGNSGKIYLVSLSGEMRGAHIHVSIQDAVDLFSQRKPSEIIVISYLYMFRSEDGITVTKEGDIYRVTTTNPRGYFFSYFYPLNQGTVDTRFFELVPARVNLFDFRLKEIRAGDRLMSLSRGRLVTLENL